MSNKNIGDDPEVLNMISKIKKSIAKNKESKPKRSDHSSDDDHKMKNDIYNGVPDYYALMGVSPNDSQDVIFRKCTEKIAQHHPNSAKVISKLNKYPPEERVKQQQKYMMQYELLSEARENLTKPEKKKLYDLQRKSVNSNTFANIKSSFDEFVKLQEADMTDDKKENARLTFDMESSKMDKKRGFDSKKKYDKDTYSWDSKETRRRVGDLETQRQQEEADTMPTMMFAQGQFNLKDFNKAFEKDKKKREKKSKKSDDRSIIKWDNIGTLDDGGASGGQYASIHNNDDDGEDAYERLYDDKKFVGSKFASRLDSDDDIDSECSISSDDIDVSYVDGHNKYKKDTFRDYEKRLAERERATTQFDSMKKDEFIDVTENPFSISHQFGEIVGENISESKMSKKEMFDAYKSLMYDRKDSKERK